MEIKTGKPCHTSNYGRGRSKSIQYIVIHFTSNNGDTAANNVNYFAGANRKASAHYFVDENNIYQSVKDGDTAWHCGTSGKYYHPSCRNANSIGIEMCSRISGGRYYIKPETVKNTIALTKQLMDKYGVPAGNVVRHYDVTHKSCPEPFVRDPALWEDFKRRLTEETEEIDMEELQRLRTEFEQERAAKDAIINTMGQEIQALKDKHNEMIYNYIDENMPEWAREPVGWFVNKGIIKGESGGELGLTYKELRLYTVMYRAIQFVCKLMKVEI